MRDTLGQFFFERQKRLLALVLPLTFSCSSREETKAVPTAEAPDASIAIAAPTPHIVGLDDYSVSVGSALTFTVRGTVPGEITLDAPHPEGLVLSTLTAETATSILRWIPLANQTGTTTLTFSLTSAGGKTSESTLVTVIPSEVGRPKFIGIPYNAKLDLALGERTVSLRIGVKDDDDLEDTLEVIPETTLPNATLEVASDGKSALFTFNPSDAQLSERCQFSTRLRAKDSSGQVATAGIFISARNGCGAESGILINEILYDPPNGEDINGDGSATLLTQEEFVEVVNVMDHPIDLTGATLSDSTALRFTFPEKTVLGAKKAAIVFGGGTPKGFAEGTLVFAASGQEGLSLSNRSDTIVLRSLDNRVLDTVVFPGDCTSCSENINQSITRAIELSRDAPFAPHNEISGESRREYSPGTRANGLPF